MFICEQCRKVAEKCEKQYKKTTKERVKQYFYEQYGTFHTGKKRLIVNDDGDPIFKVTVGHEIAKEISVCGDCK